MTSAKTVAMLLISVIILTSSSVAAILYTVDFSNSGIVLPPRGDWEILFQDSFEAYPDQFIGTRFDFQDAGSDFVPDGWFPDIGDPPLEAYGEVVNLDAADGSKSVKLYTQAVPDSSQTIWASLFGPNKYGPYEPGYYEFKARWFMKFNNLPTSNWRFFKFFHVFAGEDPYHLVVWGTIYRMNDTYEIRFEKLWGVSDPPIVQYSLETGLWYSFEFHYKYGLDDGEYHFSINDQEFLSLVGLDTSPRATYPGGDKAKIEPFDPVNLPKGVEVGIESRDSSTAYSVNVDNFMLTVVRSSAQQIPEDGPSPAGNLTPLHTEGRYLKNENNEIVHLRGSTWADLVVSDHFSTPWDVYSRATWLSDHEANVVNVKVYWGRLFNVTSWYRANTLHAIDEAVDACQKKDIYIFLSMHHDEETYNILRDQGRWQEYIDSFVFLANRYRNNPAFMGLLWWNEPYGIDSSVWFAQINIALSAMHDVNPNVILLVPDVRNWGSIPDDANIQIDPNVHTNYMWAFHHYYWLDYGSNFHQTYYEVQYGGRDPVEGLATAKEQFRDYLFYDRNLQIILNNSFPIINDEFGYFGVNCPQKHPDDPNPEPFTNVPSSYEPSWNLLEGPMEAEMSIYDELEIHWTYFVGGMQGEKSYGLWDLDVRSYEPPDYNVTYMDKGLVWRDHLLGS